MKGTTNTLYKFYIITSDTILGSLKWFGLLLYLRTSVLEVEAPNWVWCEIIKAEKKELSWCIRET